MAARLQIKERGLTMDKFEEYFEKAKDFADDAKEGMMDLFGEAMEKAKELTDDGDKVKKFTENARGQAASLTQSAKEKVEGILQDTRAGREIKQGLTELENLPEFEGSILYSMELQSMINVLRALYLLINDNRLDDASVIEEIKKAMVKVQPEVMDADADAGVSEETKAIEAAKTIAYCACERALSVMGTAAEK